MLERLSDLLNKEEKKITLSIGLASFCQNDTVVKDVDDVIKRADQALYSAKRKGKNRIAVYGDQDTDK